ncbi:hypothetical protein LCGC14_0347820 [marine sediment metagenome]|uniref:Uncharacterized protein n=1 Tax=marine sediment metagenome TaxID=412755 RepID=A0A0F9TBQ4_9ZZZZ
MREKLTSWTWWRAWLKRQLSFKAGVEAFLASFVKVRTRQERGMNKITKASKMYLGIGRRAERRRLARRGQSNRGTDKK